MSSITIDTNDNVKVLKAFRGMLNELIGDRIEPSCAAADLELEPKPAATKKSAGADTAPPTTAENTGFGLPAPGGSNEVDEKGVAFNGEFCSKAAIPFYASGKRKGQWKKRKGVTDDAYDAWYAEQTSLLPTTTTTTAAEDEQVNTAGAFGGADPTPDVQPPTDCGAFMGWASGKQAAGLLTQEDIGGAYSQAGIVVTDLFPPNDQTTIAGRVAQLYMILSAKAGA